MRAFSSGDLNIYLWINLRMVHQYVHRWSVVDRNSQTWARQGPSGYHQELWPGFGPLPGHSRKNTLGVCMAYLLCSFLWLQRATTVISRSRRNFLAEGILDFPPRLSSQVAVLMAWRLFFFLILRSTMVSFKYVSTQEWGYLKKNRSPIDSFNQVFFSESGRADGRYP